METAAVRSDLSLTLVGSEVPVVLTAALEYQSSDPYAVSVVFFTMDGPVRWVFSRDLLDEGLVHEVGDGDVQIAPMRDQFGEQVLQLRLASPDGVAVLEASADAVLDFLARSYGRVPPGHESDHLDIDAAVEALLAG